MESDSVRTVRVVIRGRVQGVGFRYWTHGAATARGLDGWVRNRADGSVEALFSGSADRVEEMLAACHSGPHASVSACTFNGPWFRRYQLGRHSHGSRLRRPGPPDPRVPRSCR